MPTTFGVVDLFAGPGGLGEGFASFTEGGHAPFRIGISVEREASAHRTLRLRAFLRRYRTLHGALPDEFIAFHAGASPEPDWPEVDAEAWRAAAEETPPLELGGDGTAAEIDAAVARLQGAHDETVLTGGPPCQACSLAGRARTRGNTAYVPRDDERHHLFRECIRGLGGLRPAAFVMENVKGMLSSTAGSRRVFEMLMEDLSSLGTRRDHGYELRAIRVEDGKAGLREASRPSGFVVRAGEFGVPQRRHRVRALAAGRAPTPTPLPCRPAPRHGPRCRRLRRGADGSEEDATDV